MCWLLCLRNRQVVSSFNNTLAVPWPAVYYAMTQALSVVSLQLLKLPTIACIQPEVSFFVIFDGASCALRLCMSRLYLTTLRSLRRDHNHDGHLRRLLSLHAPLRVESACAA